VNLAVATLGLSLVVESLILNNPRRTGGITGTQIGSVSFFGFDFDTASHPERYAVLAFVCFVVPRSRRQPGERALTTARRARTSAAVFARHQRRRSQVYAFGSALRSQAVGGVLIGSDDRASSSPDVLGLPVDPRRLRRSAASATSPVRSSAPPRRARSSLRGGDLFKSDAAGSSRSILVFVVLLAVLNSSPACHEGVKQVTKGARSGGGRSSHYR
jgi:hypothetical protein